MDELLAARNALLEALLETPRTKPELVDELSTSRSTIDRGIASLLETGCIERRDSAYLATETGRLACRARRDYLADLEQIERAEPILTELPLESIDLSFLREASIDVPSPQAPWTALETSMRHIRDASAVYGTAPVVFDLYFDEFLESIENGGLRAELILDRNLFSSLEDDQHDRLREIIEADCGRLYTTALETSYAIWIAEGETVVAGLTVYSENGLAGVLRTDDPESVDWVREQYRERRAESELVWDPD